MAQIIDDYIKILARKLLDLSPEQRQAVLAFYRDFLINGDFQTKEEIEKELGQPIDLARDVCSDYQEIAKVTHLTSPKPASDNYVRGFHVEKNPSRKRTIIPDKFINIKVTLSNADLYIHSGNSFKILITDYNSRPIEVKTEGQTLIVDEQQPPKNKGLIVINWRTATSHVEIIVPSSLVLTTISGYSTNGNVILQDINLQTMTLQQDNGDTLFNNVTLANDLTLNSKNGDVRMTQAKAAIISLKSRNSDISVKRSACGQFILQTLNGNSNIAQCNLTLKLNSKNGDVRISRSQLTNDNIVSSTAGDLYLKQLAHDMSYHLTSKHGTIIYHKSSIGNKFSSTIASNDTLQLASTDGDIIIY
ncbi:DUF4097 family beta strand repeat-containing protein [Lactobacillus sp. ESL0679]|uniref:DUF4097 family beta strand repeat-containing protein n=1 Tax=Lactobacillus sp. ESL0679 TaxID=2983209 RepID=UPI0023FA0FB3|nr:DUF4097 family beta strand repeat-containing protein [Lactobacillus sp. ESL0679]MDF7682805.1 DUF4097 family beta strand repeat-containing protein [Lactobacillus sp. ESL0679]